MSKLCNAGVSMCLLMVLFASQGISQQRVDPRNLYERVYCVLPMVGAGTYDDPRRPAFAPLRAVVIQKTLDGVEPAPGQVESQSVIVRSGILAYSYEVSDDGQSALVEFVAVDRKAFQEILEAAQRDPRVKVFEKGKARREDVEREFRKYKRDLRLEKLVVRVP